MRRRTFIAATAVSAVSASAVQAGPKSGGAAPATLNMAGVGLPVIAEGRVQNYVFVSMRLHLGAGKTPEQMRAKEPWFRDALIKAGHRTPFTVANDWTRLNAQAMAAALLTACNAIAGRGSVSRVEIVSQAPRRRTGVRSG